MHRLRALLTAVYIPYMYLNLYNLCMIISHFRHNEIDMAFISLMHWHAIGTFEQATKDDQAIQALAAKLRAIWLRHGLRYITDVQ